MLRTQRQKPAHADQSEPGRPGQSCRSLSPRGSNWLPSPALKLSGKGGARGGLLFGKSAGRPRCSRMRLISLSSSITVTSFISPPQPSQRTGSTSKIRFRHAAHARDALLAPSRAARPSPCAAASKPSTAKPALSLLKACLRLDRRRQRPAKPRARPQGAVVAHQVLRGGGMMAAKRTRNSRGVHWST